jgi:hypothetical protein
VKRVIAIYPIMHTCTMEEVVIDTSVFGRCSKEGIDEYGNMYEKINGKWEHKKKTDYDLAFENFRE